jgi:hypothetical protein
LPLEGLRVLTWRRRVLEALRLVAPSPETVLHRALRKCGARLVRFPSGAVYIETRHRQLLKVEEATGQSDPRAAAQVLDRRRAAIDRHNDAVRQALRERAE